MNEVVVTGMGVVSSLGHDTHTFWSALRDGHAVIEPSEVPGVPWVSPVSDGWSAGLGRVMERQTDRCTQMAVVAVRQALEQAGLIDHADLSDAVICVGSSIGGIGTISQEFAAGTTRGLRHVSPMIIPKGLINMIAANIAIEFGVHGESVTLASACASGTVAVGEGYRRISRGEADIAIVGGAEACMIDQVVEPFRRLGALSQSETRDQASVPFSRHRTGFVMGEGSGALVLESAEHARRRQATVLGRILGYGGSTDARHRIAPSADGMRRCVENLLANCPVAADSVGYINAHGTSTELNDRLEAQVLSEFFPHRPWVSSTKSYYGHPLGAAGAFETIITLLSLRDRIAIPILDVSDDDVDTDEIDLNLALHEAKPLAGDRAVSTSFAFGGHNAALMLGA